MAASSSPSICRRYASWSSSTAFWKRSSWVIRDDDSANRTPRAAPSSARASAPLLRDVAPHHAHREPRHLLARRETKRPGARLVEPAHDDRRLLAERGERRFDDALRRGARMRLLPGDRLELRLDWPRRQREHVDPRAPVLRPQRL